VSSEPTREAIRTPSASACFMETCYANAPWTTSRRSGGCTRPPAVDECLRDPVMFRTSVLVPSANATAPARRPHRVQRSDLWETPGGLARRREARGDIRARGTADRRRHRAVIARRSTASASPTSCATSSSSRWRAAGWYRCSPTGRRACPLLRR
jgi:hypothetical protein